MEGNDPSRRRHDLTMLQYVVRAGPLSSNIHCISANDWTATSSEHCCDSCQRSFVHRMALEQHWTQSSHHVWCLRCDRHFKCWDDMNKHLNASYSHWLCQRCDIDFATYDVRKEHYNLSPNHHFCGRCEEDFETANALDRHYRESYSHNICVICERDFTEPNQLRQVSLACTILIRSDLPDKHNSILWSTVPKIHPAMSKAVNANSVPNQQ